MFTSNPFLKVVFYLNSKSMSCEEETKNKEFTSVITRAMVDNESISFSKNLGWSIPSSFLSRNQVLLISVWMRGERNIPNCCSGSYSGRAKD